jgi:hypothetical protein
MGWIPVGGEDDAALHLAAQLLGLQQTNARRETPA